MPSSGHYVLGGLLSECCCVDVLGLNLFPEIGFEHHLVLGCQYRIVMISWNHPTEELVA